MSDVGLHRLNAMDTPEALKALGRCCGSSSWCFKIASGRPYPSRTELLRFSDLKFRSLTKIEWFEAFAHHPPIGDQASVDRSAESGWSADEQSLSLQATPEVLASLLEMNRDYYRRFGYTFIVFAEGLEASDILLQMRRRYRHDPYDEMTVAGEHQRRITRSRVEKLLDELSALSDVPQEAPVAGDEAEKADAWRPTGSKFGEPREPEYLKARGRPELAEDSAKKSA